MSTKFFKNMSKKKATAIAPPPPRELAAIMTEFNQLKSQAGELQYVIYAHTKDLETLNRRLEQINEEGGQRKKLDADAAAAKAAIDKAAEEATPNA